MSFISNQDNPWFRNERLPLQPLNARIIEDDEGEDVEVPADVISDEPADKLTKEEKEQLAKETNGWYIDQLKQFDNNVETPSATFEKEVKTLADSFVNGDISKNEFLTKVKELYESIKTSAENAKGERQEFANNYIIGPSYNLTTKPEYIEKNCIKDFDQRAASVIRDYVNGVISREEFTTIINNIYNEIVESVKSAHKQAAPSSDKKEYDGSAIGLYLYNNAEFNDQMKELYLSLAGETADLNAFPALYGNTIGRTVPILLNGKQKVLLTEDEIKDKFEELFRESINVKGVADTRGNVEGITDTEKTQILNQVKADAVSKGIDGVKLTEEQAGKLLDMLSEDADIKTFKGTKDEFIKLVNEKAKTYASNILSTPSKNVKDDNPSGNNVTDEEKTRILNQVKADAVSKGIDGIKLTEEQAGTLQDMLKEDADITAFKGTIDEFIKLVNEKAKTYAEQIKSQSDAANEERSITDATKSAAEAAFDALSKNENSVARANRISGTIYSLEQEYASTHNGTKVNTNYSINAYGDMKFSDPYVQTMFNGLFDHLKEVVGTDGFDEKTLKQLYQTAWEMAYSKYPNNQENDISDFLTQVYNNFKQIIVRLKDKPEYLDIFTGKTTDGTKTSETRVVNTANMGTGGGYVKCDTKPNVYSDGSVHVSDDESDVNLQKAVKAILEKLQKAYPNIPVATLKAMLNAAVKKAVENIGNNRTSEIPGNFYISSNKTYANIVANLALHYFEQELYAKALNDNTLLSATSPAKANEAEKEPDDAVKEKYKTAAQLINGMLTDIFDNSYINGFLSANDCSGAHWLEMDVNANGTFDFSDWKTRKAYNELLNAMKSKSGFKNSGLTDSEFKQIYNAAWLSIYNDFDNNQKYDLNTVLNKVIAKMQKILDKIASDPKYLKIIENGSAMSQVSYNAQQVRYYDVVGDRDSFRDYGDGNVHLSDDESDKKYQKAVDDLRAKLKGRYVPPLSEYQFNAWFAKAQKEAILACAKNSRDITKDLQVEGGTRHHDNWTIRVDELMELIAYKFDKLVYKGVFG